jgi:hypothetical protein
MGKYPGRLLGAYPEFPTQRNRELFRRNREFWRRNREFYLQISKSLPSESFGSPSFKIDAEAIFSSYATSVVLN